MRISKLYLENIAEFEKEEIIFPKKTNFDKAEIHLFTGENGSGKSTILYSLVGFEDSELIKDRCNSGKKCFYSVEFNGQDKFEHTINLCKQIGIDEIREKRLAPKIVEEYRGKKNNFLESTFDFAFFAYSSYKSLNLVSSKDPIKTINLDTISNPFHGSSRFPNPGSIFNLERWIILVKTKEAIAEKQEAEKQEAEKQEGKSASSKYSDLIDRVQKTISELINKKIYFIVTYEPIKALIRLNDELLDINSLSEGLKTIINLIADLLIRLEEIRWTENKSVLEQNFILFLDEIDIHLHPAWQRKILPFFQKLFKNAQIFATTHSPFVVGSIEDGWVYRLTCSGKYSKISKPIKSKAGHGLLLILKEIFGVEEEFDIETEEKLKRFYILRDELISNSNKNKDEFVQLADELAQKSLEIQTLIGIEIRKVERLIGIRVKFNDETK